jgi:hypothetical protein
LISLRARQINTMKSLRTLRVLAYVNLVIGALMALIAASMVFSLLINEPKRSIEILLFSLVLLTVFGCMSFVILRTVRAFFKNPNRAVALDLSRNSAVIVWFVIGGLTQKTPLKELVGLWYAPMVLLVAYSTYRFLFKPAALAVFPAATDLPSNEAR